MPVIRCQVRLPYFTGLPEDIVTNTMYFETTGPGPSTSEINEAIGRILAAYEEIDQHLASVLSRSANVCEIRVYNMDDPEPRTPLETALFTLDAVLTAPNLPLECSLVLSYRGEFVSGVPNARRRGRLYLGPWQAAASSGGGGAIMPTIQPAIIGAATNFGQALATQIGTPLTWVQWSPTAGVASEVVELWVDNEWDTQRRRQARATARTTQPVVQ